MHQYGTNMNNKSIHNFKSVEVAKRVNEVIRLKLQGKKYKEIENYITTAYDVTTHTVAKDVEIAKKKIKELLSKELVHVRTIHADRYYFFYDQFEKWGYDKYAMDALANVERLMGLGSPLIGISIDNMIERKKKPNLYDYTKLSKEEMTRLKELVDKCKKK